MNVNKIKIWIKSHVNRFIGPPVSVGQFGKWQSQGIMQWTESRRIVKVEFFQGRWFAWCDGSMTAIPADEIICDEL